MVYVCVLRLSVYQHCIHLILIHAYTVIPVLIDTPLPTIFTHIDDHASFTYTNRKGLSGGEKRRVSIAVELLAASEIMCLDEPTSGLDSSASKSVVTALETIVALGRGVLLSIHQPSSSLFSKFGKVLLLSAQGYVLYSGPNARLQTFMASSGLAIPSLFNPAEFLLDICVDEDQSDVVQQAYEGGSIQAHERKLILDRLDNAGRQVLDEIALSRSLQAPWTRQVKFLGLRCFYKVVRHPMLAMVNVGGLLGMSFTVGVLYHDITFDLPGALNRGGLFFFLLAYLMLTSLADLGVWHEERVLFMRERASGCYSPSAYGFAFFFAELLPIRLIPLAMMTFIITFMVG